MSAGVDVAVLWELLSEEGVRYDPSDLAELAIGETSPEALADVVDALAEDRIHFKERKGRFEPRSAVSVQESLRQRKLAEEREERLRATTHAVRVALSSGRPLPVEEHEEVLRPIVDLAVYGDAAPKKQAGEELLGALGWRTKGALWLSAFRLLNRLGWFEEDENLLLRRFRVPTRFPATVLEEAEQVVAGADPAEDPARVDRTGAWTLAIDDAETREVDDALSAEPLPDGGTRVEVHIADAAAFVPSGGAIEHEAARRAATVYLPDRMLPMLPPDIGYGVASLGEGIRRPALTFRIDLDARGQIQDFEPFESVISVDRRLTYRQANALLGEDSAEGRLLRLGGYSVAAGVTSYRPWLVEGTTDGMAVLPRLDPAAPAPGLLVGRGLAKALDLVVGDVVSLTAEPEDEKAAEPEPLSDPSGGLLIRLTRRGRFFEPELAVDADMVRAAVREVLAEEPPRPDAEAVKALVREALEELRPAPDADAVKALVSEALEAEPPQPDADAVRALAREALAEQEQGVDEDGVRVLIAEALDETPAPLDAEAVRGIATETLAEAPPALDTEAVRGLVAEALAEAPPALDLQAVREIVAEALADMPTPLGTGEVGEIARRVAAENPPEPDPADVHSLVLQVLEASPPAPDPSAVREMLRHVLAENPPEPDPATVHSVVMQVLEAAPPVPDVDAVEYMVTNILKISPPELDDEVIRAAVERVTAADAGGGPAAAAGIDEERVRDIVYDVVDTAREQILEAAKEAARQAAAALPVGVSGAAADGDGAEAAAERVAWEVVPDLAERILWEIVPEVAQTFAEEAKRRSDG